MSTPRTSQNGFTLIELIIAMTLAALIVALGASILRMGMDFYHRSHDYIRQQQEVRGFLKLLHDELQGASKGALVLNGEQTRLNFTTDNMPAGIGRSGQNNVSLECRENELGQIELIHRILLKKAVEEKEKMPEKGAAPEYEEEPLVHRLSQCAFSFLERDDKASKPRAFWTDEWREGKGLPLAVRVQLTPPTGNIPPVVIPLN
jgi:prepilin-type N-terminal cleavage/methylation domain-containing protein